jgi:hypothetical protein
MKNVILALALLSVPAFAATDAANQAETSVKTTKNPITGSVTTTKKSKRSMKSGKKIAKLEATETTKTKTNGEVEKKVEVKGSSTDAPAAKK